MSNQIGHDGNANIQVGRGPKEKARLLSKRVTVDIISKRALETKHTTINNGEKQPYGHIYTDTDTVL